MMTSAQVVETSVNVTLNSPSQDYTHPDDHNLPNYKICLLKMILVSMDVTVYCRVIPSNSLRIITANNLLLSREINGQFLLNEHGDLSFLSHNFRPTIT